VSPQQPGPGSLVDHVCRIITTAGVSLPTFFTGLLLVYVFYYLAGWAPAPLGRLDVFSTAPPRWSGFYLVDSLVARDFETFRAALAQLVLPAATLAIFSLAPLARITRAAMLAALASEFVRTARASSLPPLRIIFVYAFGNAVLPVITTLGIVCSFLIGGSVLVEKVFAWPGIGSYAVEALIASDYAPVQGFVLMMALLYVCSTYASTLCTASSTRRCGSRHDRDDTPCRLCASREPGHRFCVRVVSRVCAVRGTRSVVRPV